MMDPACLMNELRIIYVRRAEPGRQAGMRECGNQGIRVWVTSGVASSGVSGSGDFGKRLSHRTESRKTGRRGGANHPGVLRGDPRCADRCRRFLQSSDNYRHRNFEIPSRRTKTPSISESYRKELALGLFLALVILNNFQSPGVYQFYVSHYEKRLPFLIEVDNAPRKRGTISRLYIVLDRIFKVVYDG